VCSYFSGEPTLGEYARNKTDWKNIASNQLIDEDGEVFRKNGTDSSLKIFNLQNTKESASIGK
jgi:hypothetical protein